MRILLFMLALLVPASAAELTLSSLSVYDIDHSSAMVCWTATGNVATDYNGIKFDTPANAGNYRFKTPGEAHTFRADPCFHISGLAPSTTYSICPQVSDQSGNSTDCTSTGNAGSKTTFTTTADVPHPVIATLPDPFPYNSAPPATYQKTYNVTSCGTFVSTYNTAVTWRTNNPNDNVKVIVDATLSCQDLWIYFPVFTSGTGHLVVASSMEAYLPPYGSRVNKTLHAQYMPKFRMYSLYAQGFMLGSGATGNSFLHLIGLHLVGPPADYTVGQHWSNAIIGLESGGPYSSFTIDRCLLGDDRAIPVKANFGVVLMGDNNTIIGNHFYGFQHVEDPGVSGTEGPFPIAILTADNIQIINNEVDCQGICIYAPGYDSGKARNVTVKNNWVHSNEAFWATTSSQRGAYGRHQLECKVCEKWLIEGNLFTDHHSGVRQAGAAIAFKVDWDNVPNNAYSRDITFRNNIVRNVGYAIQSSGGLGNTNPLHTKAALRRITVTNNFFDIDGFATLTYGRTLGDSNYSGMFWGMWAGNVDDVTITHNTILSKNGGYPVGLNIGEAVSEGLHFEGNIMLASTSSLFAYTRGALYAYGGSGMDNYSPSVPAAAPTSSTVFGKQQLDLTWTRNDGSSATNPPVGYVWRNNLLIAGCSDTYTQLANCNDSQTSLMSTSTVASNFPNDTVVTGATFGARMNVPGFISRSGGNYRLATGSTYRSGGAGRALSGKDMGVDYDALNDALGYVRNVSVSGGVLRYTPPSTNACTVRKDGVDTSDGGGSRLPRSVSVAGSTTVVLYCGTQAYMCPSSGYCTLQ